jgi:hypothetical protein
VRLQRSTWAAFHYEVNSITMLGFHQVMHPNHIGMSRPPKMLPLAQEGGFAAVPFSIAFSRLLPEDFYGNDALNIILPKVNLAKPTRTDGPPNLQV